MSGCSVVDRWQFKRSTDGSFMHSTDGSFMHSTDVSFRHSTDRWQIQYSWHTRPSIQQCLLLDAFIHTAHFLHAVRSIKSSRRHWYTMVQRTLFVCTYTNAPILTCMLACSSYSDGRAIVGAVWTCTVEEHAYEAHFWISKNLLSLRRKFLKSDRRPRLRCIGKYPGNIKKVFWSS